MRLAVEGIHRLEEGSPQAGEGSLQAELGTPVGHNHPSGVGRLQAGEDKLQAGVGIHRLGEGSLAEGDIRDNSFL